MTKTEIELLAKACRMAGIDASKIAPANPFEKSGKVAEMLQVAVAELNPTQAAKWRVAAGGGLSIQTLSELQSGQELSQQAQRDLWNHDPQFVADVQRQQVSAEEQALKSLEEGAAATRLRNKVREVGNEARAREALKAEDDRDAQLKVQREESQRHAQQMQQRIDQKRIEHAQMAGRLTNG